MEKYHRRPPKHQTARHAFLENSWEKKNEDHRCTKDNVTDLQKLVRCLPWIFSLTLNQCSDGTAVATVCTLTHLRRLVILSVSLSDSDLLTFISETADTSVLVRGPASLNIGDKWCDFTTCQSYHILPRR